MGRRRDRASTRRRAGARSTSRPWRRAWPGCPLLADGGTVLLLDGGTPPPDAGIVLDPYSACGFLACGTGTTCTTLQDGPSGCIQLCNMSPGSCPQAQVCNKGTIYSTKDAGTCIPGCTTSADCVNDAGPQVCSTCEQICVAPGKATANIGDLCQTDSQCPNGAYCATSRNFPNGYCTQPCSLTAATDSACSCPPPSECGVIGRFPVDTCLATCANIGDDCRAGTSASRRRTACRSAWRSAPSPRATARRSTRASRSRPESRATSTAASVEARRTLSTRDRRRRPPPIDLPGVNDDLGAPPANTCGCGAGGLAPFALGLLSLMRRRSRRANS